MRLVSPETNFMNAVDTNVLIYVHDPPDPDKRATAVSLLDSLTNLALVWQVACEYLAASRKLARFGYNLTNAWQDEMRNTWTTILPGWAVQDLAERLASLYSISFWDAMIIAACLDGGVSTRYSEGFNGYSNVEGLSLINPFKVP